MSFLGSVMGSETVKSSIFQKQNKN